MWETISNIIGLEIYNPEGIFVGIVDEVVIDLPTMKAYGLYVEKANPTLVDDNISISIPFSWVRGIGDVVILRTFPDHVGVEVDPQQESLQSSR
ncbi:MAG TPA: PRC-barrel domain-containing protein [Candidatus Methanomethylophilaceae archaeon]|nr:PRC-barrel domain-containing protein [Candidatus Methanomethylophilaceae archaeon]